MVVTKVTWGDRKRLEPSVYQWKGRLLTCERWALTSEDGTRVCEIEHNGRGFTVDFLKLDTYGCGTILAFCSVSTYDLLHRRIYPNGQQACVDDVLGWVNDWRAPVSGVDGGILLSIDQWGNEVAV